jgi:excisionase family DNA binding protein
MAIHNLANHAAPYVTVRELAEYWRVSQKQVRRRVASGSLRGLRLGPRIWRITVASALAFERASEQALEDATRPGREVAPEGAALGRPH